MHSELVHGCCNSSASSTTTPSHFPSHLFSTMSLLAKRLTSLVTRGSSLRRYTTSPFSFSGYADAASMPVVRDALVPIVIEQTVSPFAPSIAGRQG